MADNITAPAIGAVLATDDILGVHHPFTKVEFGVDGVATPVTAATPLPVTFAGSGFELGATSLAALETITVGGTVDLGATSLAALESITTTGPLTDVQLRATSLTTTVTGGATSAKQDETTAAINALAGTEYETVAASVTDQIMGATGAIGDLLIGLLIVPTNTSPGAVTIKDGASGAVITVFAGGASSISTLHPIPVPLNLKALAAGWRVTTGAGLSLIAIGNFT